MVSRVLRISNHPLTKYSDKLKENYVRGLGCVLHTISNGHPDMRTLFEQWGYSILPEADVPKWFQSEDCSFVKKALALYREGFRFFRVKLQFFFDCFYLTEIFDSSLLAKLKGQLTETGNKIFTKSALNQTAEYFSSGNGSLKIEDSLINHRNDNRSFASLPEKNILVVATVSAGKSTLINALTGHFFNKAMSGICTKQICKIHNKYSPDGITYRKDGYHLYNPNSEYVSSEESTEVGIHFESSLGNFRICITDTPGVNNALDTGHLKITMNAIKSLSYDLVIFISNGLYNGTNDERSILNSLYTETKKPIIFVLNQLDRFNPRTDDINRMIKAYRRELDTIGFKSPSIYPLSAQYALFLRKQTDLDEEEMDEFDSIQKRFSNSFFDLQKYIGEPSSNEIEKSGIISLEKAIIQNIQ